MSNISQPYGDWAKVYRDIGLEPRPVRYPGSDPKTGKAFGKACKEPNWNKQDEDIPQLLAEWDAKYPHYNIGLRMGTLLPDGTRLGALDVDHDDYVGLAKTLFGGEVFSGRFGSKGIVIFFRYLTAPQKRKHKVIMRPGEDAVQVVELLLEGQLCVIPPSIHPDTKNPYVWVGMPLHEVDLLQLPLIGGGQ